MSGRASFRLPTFHKLGRHKERRGDQCKCKPSLLQNRNKIGLWISIVPSFRRILGPPLPSIFSRAGSTHMTEDSRKVLLGFEAAGQGDIEDTRLRGAQHLLRTFYSVA